MVNGSKDRDAVERVVGEIRNAGGKAHGVMADVSQDADAARLVAACTQSFGSADILVSNVGIRRYQSFLDISPADWDTVLRTNLSAAFYLARHAIPHMRARRWGRIVLISGFDGFWGQVTQCAHNITWGPACMVRQGASTRVRRRRHHGQHGRARRHRYRARLEPVSASGEAADRKRDPVPPLRRSARGRGRGRVPGIARRRLHLRPGHARERRPLHDLAVPGISSQWSVIKTRWIVIPGRAKGASPESIITGRGYGFRARPFGPSRNDRSA